MEQFKASFALALVLLSSVGTVSAFAEPVAPPDLSGVLDGSSRAANDSSAESEIAPIRLASLKESALGYGVRSGLAHRSYEISMMLNGSADLLDRMFAFAPLLLDRNVMPPVLSTGEGSLNQPNAETIRVADATYRIERQARFVTTPTNWRDYLLNDFKFQVELPATSLLPKSSAEKKVFDQNVKDGWTIGVEQADGIFDQSLARLERDMEGMIIYKDLLRKDMITKPFVAESNLGITGDDSEIKINDRILRITAKPRLQTNPAVWKPVAVPK